MQSFFQTISEIVSDNRRPEPHSFPAFAQMTQVERGTGCDCAKNGNYRVSKSAVYSAQAEQEYKEDAILNSETTEAESTDSERAIRILRG